MRQNKYHLLVIDDDRRLRDLLKRFLRENDFLISTAQDAQEAWKKLEFFLFDLIILDVMMPGENGLQFLEKLRGKSKIPTLFLSAKWETEDRIEGLEKGADDYLSKPFEPKELLLRIQSILRRIERKHIKKEYVLGDCLFNREREILTKNGELINLTSTELSLLKILLDQEGQPIQREDLIDRLSVVINPRSVDVQITRLRRKIERDPKNPHYLLTIRNEGYVLRPDA